LMHWSLGLPCSRTSQVWSAPCKGSLTGRKTVTTAALKSKMLIRLHSLPVSLRLVGYTVASGFPQLCCWVWLDSLLPYGRILIIQILKEHTISTVARWIIFTHRNVKKNAWFLVPTHLLIHGQWWSNRSTQTSHVLQCLLLGVLITWQYGQIETGSNFCSSI
jgi:hypothetical protein